MQAFPAKQTVLVPIMGGDISKEAVAVATTLLAQPDSQLVLLHVNPGPPDVGDAETARIEAEQEEPRWHRLASTAAPNRTFVDAVMGDPAEEILGQAERFHSDVIVLDPTPTHARPNEWVDRAIAELLLASPRTVRVEPRSASATRTSHPREDAQSVTPTEVPCCPTQRSFRRPSRPRAITTAQLLSASARSRSR